MRATRVQIFHEHLLVKEPGTGKATPWHHDMPYYCVQGEQVVSFWLALDPVALEVAPSFVAGSHRWGRLYYPRLFDDGTDYDFKGAGYETVPDIEAERDKHRILAWAMEPGDALAFHFLTLHAAPGNEGVSRRRGFSTRWLPPPRLLDPLAGRRCPLRRAARRDLAALSRDWARGRRTPARGLVPRGVARPAVPLKADLPE
jgi:ectoine hydroxylase-related dioxygenase (phytanoyl-CoA dioxygenase family)